MDKVIHEYILEQIKPRCPFFNTLEEYAQANQVPIMEPDSMQIMLEIMQIQKPKRILEIGTAIGYSCLRMQEALPETEIITIERDEQRYQEALKNIKAYKGAHHVTALLGDALIDVKPILDSGPFDAIFIDAAKAQYSKFFQIYTPSLTASGVVYSDNVLFKGLGLKLSEQEKKKARVARKMREFNLFLNQQSDFSTTIIPLGDGLAISRRI